MRIRIWLIKHKGRDIAFKEQHSTDIHAISYSTLQLLRALSQKHLSSFDLANILGRDMEVDEDSELLTARFFERLVFGELTKYKDLLENLEEELPSRVDSVLNENIRILANAWKRFKE